MAGLRHTSGRSAFTLYQRSPGESFVVGELCSGSRPSGIGSSSRLEDPSDATGDEYNIRWRGGGK
eukprot:1012686-Pyramimonas_sp.AAC.1